MKARSSFIEIRRIFKIMISDFKFFHGVALLELSRNSTKLLKVESLKDLYENSAYSINGIGVYIKHSEKRLTPWRFSFLKKHQDTIFELKTIFEEVVILLVCGKDGIAGIGFNELKLILDDEHEEVEWIKVDRTKNSLYGISGSNGKLNFKISKDDFLKKILKEDFINS